jgi:glycosyltransferase involved in cell wall biosynthesis
MTVEVARGKDSISVLIPVLNGEKFIREALDSVLAQSLASEIIVIDNGSIDGTLEIIHYYVENNPRVKLLQCSEKGVSKALNTGLVNANGTLIARLDADDKMSLDRLDKQLKVMEDNPNLALVSSQIVYMNSDGIEIGRSKYPVGRLKLLKHFILRNPIAHPSVMFRKEAAEKAGNYRSEFEGCEDLDLWIRILRYGNIFSINDCLTYYRVHKNQITVRGSLYDAELKLRILYLKEFFREPIYLSLFSILQLVRIIDLTLMKSKVIAQLRRRIKSRIGK